MRIWVLTGDKIETAINIGFACKLLSSDMDQFVVDAVDETSVEQQLQSIRHTQREGEEGAYALIVHGDALTLVQENQHLKEDFLVLAESA